MEHLLKLKVQMLKVLTLKVHRRTSNRGDKSGNGVRSSIFNARCLVRG